MNGIQTATTVPTDVDSYNVTLALADLLLFHQEISSVWLCNVRPRVRDHAIYNNWCCIARTVGVVLMPPAAGPSLH